MDLRNTTNKTDITQMALQTNETTHYSELYEATKLTPTRLAAIEQDIDRLRKFQKTAILIPMLARIKVAYPEIDVHKYITPQEQERMLANLHVWAEEDRFSLNEDYIYSVVILFPQQSREFVYARIGLSSLLAQVYGNESIFDLVEQLVTLIILFPDFWNDSKILSGLQAHINAKLPYSMENTQLQILALAGLIFPNQHHYHDLESYSGEFFIDRLIKIIRTAEEIMNLHNVEDSALDFLWYAKSVRIIIGKAQIVDDQIVLTSLPTEDESIPLTLPLDLNF